jgi:hypothetical protein
MKPFHYNQDPLYDAAASILQGQQLTEDIIAFKNLGFKQLNGLMSDDEIHRAVNSTIKRESLKLGDSTWNVVTDIYGRRDDGTWTGDWILARKGGGAWLTTKDGGAFKAHDSIISVLSFFEMEEGMEEEVKVDKFEEGVKAISEDVFKKLLTKAALMFTSAKDIADSWYEGASGEMKKMKSALTPDNVEKFVAASAALSRVHDEAASMKSGKDAMAFLGDAAKIESLIMKYTEEILKKGVIRKENKSYELEEGALAPNKFAELKMIKNQLQTIVRNSNVCLQMVEDDHDFPEWAQSEIAVAEAGIVSVTEFMESHTSDKEEIDEAPSSFKMGTATITKSGHFMDGKQVNVFHKFDDGRINAQYRKNDSRGRMVYNITLKPDEYKMNQGSLSEETISKSVLEKLLHVLETQRFVDWYEDDFNDYIERDLNGKTREEILEDLKSLLEKGYPVRESAWKKMNEAFKI